MPAEPLTSRNITAPKKKTVFVPRAQRECVGHVFLFLFLFIFFLFLYKKKTRSRISLLPRWPYDFVGPTKIIKKNKITSFTNCIDQANITGCVYSFFFYPSFIHSFVRPSVRRRAEKKNFFPCRLTTSLVFQLCSY